MNVIGSCAHGRALMTTHATASTSAIAAVTRRLRSGPHAANTRRPGTDRHPPRLALGSPFGSPLGTFDMRGILERVSQVSPDPPVPGSRLPAGRGRRLAHQTRTDVQYRSANA